MRRSSSWTARRVGVRSGSRSVPQRPRDPLGRPAAPHAHEPRRPRVAVSAAALHRPGYLPETRRSRRARRRAARARRWRDRAVASHGRSYTDLAAHTVKFGPWLPRHGVVPIDDGPSSRLLVPRDSWLRVGGIPEEGMLGDTMFCWALVDAGYPLHLAGEAVLEHDHATTVGALTRERFARGREFAALRRGRWPGSDRRRAGRRDHPLPDPARTCNCSGLPPPPGACRAGPKP